jgi:hypothetical protein
MVILLQKIKFKTQVNHFRGMVFATYVHMLAQHIPTNQQRMKVKFWPFGPLALTLQWTLKHHVWLFPILST